MARGRPGGGRREHWEGDERTALGLGFTLFTARPRDCRHVLLWVEGPKNTGPPNSRISWACLDDVLVRFRASRDALLDPLAQGVEVEGPGHPVALS
jgi:hypothetical protein